MVHFDIPRNIESYYQKPVAPGVMACPAEAMLFYDPADMAWLAPLSGREAAGALQDIERHKLNAMGAFAEAQTCRRWLLNYFGEGRSGAVRELRYLPRSAETYDGSTMLRLPFHHCRVNQRFGMGYVVEEFAVLITSVSATMVMTN